MIIQLDLLACSFSVYMLTALWYVPLDGSLENFNSSTNFVEYLSQGYLLIDFYL